MRKLPDLWFDGISSNFVSLALKTLNSAPERQTLLAFVENVSEDAARMRDEGIGTYSFIAQTFHVPTTLLLTASSLNKK